MTCIYVFGAFLGLVPGTEEVLNSEADIITPFSSFPTTPEYREWTPSQPRRLTSLAKRTKTVLSFGNRDFNGHQWGVRPRYLYCPLPAAFRKEPGVAGAQKGVQLPPTPHLLTGRTGRKQETGRADPTGRTRLFPELGSGKGPSEPEGHIEDDEESQECPG